MKYIVLFYIATCCICCNDIRKNATDIEKDSHLDSLIHLFPEIKLPDSIIVSGDSIANMDFSKKKPISNLLVSKLFDTVLPYNIGTNRNKLVCMFNVHFPYGRFILSDSIICLLEVVYISPAPDGPNLLLVLNLFNTKLNHSIHYYIIGGKTGNDLSYKTINGKLIKKEKNIELIRNSFWTYTFPEGNRKVEITPKEYEYFILGHS